MTQDTELPLPSVCPFCDNAIMDYEEATLYVAHEAKSLAHSMCMADIEIGEEDDAEND